MLGDPFSDLPQDVAVGLMGIGSVGEEDDDIFARCIEHTENRRKDCGSPFMSTEVSIRDDNDDGGFK